MTSNLYKRAVAALMVLSSAGCAMVGYGECFSRCGGNMPSRYDYGAPADPTRGKLSGDRIRGETEKYRILGFVTLERVGEPPGSSKVNAQAYVPGITAQQAKGSAWFSVTFGSDYVDPVTLRPREGRISAEAPLIPPGIYKLTAQASVVEKLYSASPTYFPFRSPPQSTTIVVEAGKWSFLMYKVQVDESTQPLTITVDYWQAGKEMLPLMQKSAGFYFSPDFVIADPLPTSASSIPSVEAVAP